MSYKAIVIGSSAGGLAALKELLSPLKKSFKIPIIIVQHISPQSDNYITTYLDNLCELNVKEADQRELIKDGHVYFATPNFHLLVEENYTFALSTEDRVNYARPSIDVLFETASFAYGEKLIGIILTGANHDGAKGLRTIKERGGLTIVQDPKEAEVDSMPLNAIKNSKVDQVLKLKDIADFLNQLG